MKTIFTFILFAVFASASAQSVSGYFLASNNWSNDTIYYRIEGSIVNLWAELTCSNAMPSTTLASTTPAIIQPFSGMPTPNSAKGRRLPSGTFYDAGKGNVIPIYLNINGYPNSPLNYSYYSRVSNKLTIGDQIQFSVTYLK